MQSVFEAFNVGQRYKTDGDIGVEIEVEGHNLPTPEKYWKKEYDGSLRGESAEYVLKKPLSLLETSKAITYLGHCYKQNKTTVHESVRAGVHVHINVQDLTVVQLFSFITAYIVLEDLLVKFCGQYREGNLFCLRVKDAEYLLYSLEKVAANKQYHHLHTDILRYASMNVKSLQQYGSLEFRAMRGTKDLMAIRVWVKILYNLRNQSVKFDSPKHIVDYIEKEGSESFCKLFLGTSLNTVCGKLDVNKYVNDGLLRAYNLACNTDWDSFVTRTIGELEFPINVEFPDEPLEDF